MSALTVLWDTYFSDRPADGDSPQYADDRIRETRLATEERLGREHLLVASGAFDTNDNQGYHRPGSAIAYYQAAAPTTLPDAADALASGGLSNGRLWIDTDTDRLKYYKAGTWTDVITVGIRGYQHSTGATTAGAIYTSMAADLEDGQSMMVSGSLRSQDGTLLYIASRAVRSGTTITLYANYLSYRASPIVVTGTSLAMASGGSTVYAVVSLAW